MYSHILSENLNENKKWYSTEKTHEKVTYRQHATKWFFPVLRPLFFSLFLHLKKTYIMICFWLDNRCCNSVIYKYPSGFKLNINKKMLKLIWNNQIGKLRINGLFIATLNYIPFHFYLFSVLVSYYIPANLLTYQRCWHVKINLLSALMYLIRLNLMKFQVCYNFVSFLIFEIVIECPEESFKKLCNYLFIW